MPYIHIQTNKDITDKIIDIKEAGGLSITNFPGKTEQYLMMHIEDKKTMYFGGQDTECMMIEVYLYGSTTDEGKDNFTQDFINRISSITGIASDTIYLTITEKDEWGMFGNYYRK